jgi:hypothetical protein
LFDGWRGIKERRFYSKGEWDSKYSRAGTRPVIMDLVSTQFFLISRAKIEVTDKAGHQGGREKAVENPVVIDKIQPKPKKERGRRSRKGFQSTNPVRIKRKRFPAAARAIL